MPTSGRLPSVCKPVMPPLRCSGSVKGFAFWPQIAMGQPPLTTVRQAQVAETSVDMFLACYD